MSTPSSPSHEPSSSPERAAPPRARFFWWLAHHREAEADRCLLLPFPWRPLAVCARCAALYPTLLAAIALQSWLATPRLGTADHWIALLGAAPALLDWGTGRLGRAGSHAGRLITGVLLGVALGRSLYLHFLDPPGEVLGVQVALLLFGALAFEVVRHLRFD